MLIQSFFYEEYSVSELDMLTSIPCSMCFEFDGYIALDNILSGTIMVCSTVSGGGLGGCENFYFYLLLFCCLV